jgi:hypothetical protein
MKYLCMCDSLEKTLGQANNTFTVHAIMCGEEGRGSACGIVTCNTQIRQGDLVEIGQTRTGNPRLIKQSHIDDHTGYIVKASASGAYTRGTEGYIDVLRGQPTLLAQGQCSWGDAGNMGHYAENIYALAVGDVLRVRRASPSKGYKPYFVIASPDTIFVFSETELVHYLDNVYRGEIVKGKSRSGQEYDIPAF